MRKSPQGAMTTRRGLLGIEAYSVGWDVPLHKGDEPREVFNGRRRKTIVHVLAKVLLAGKMSKIKERRFVMVFVADLGLDRLSHHRVRLSLS